MDELICTTHRYHPHVLAGSSGRRQNGRRSPGKPHPYGAFPWYSTWMVDQGPFRLRSQEDGKWMELEGPVAVVLPPFSEDQLELPVSTLFSWLEWGALSLERVERLGGGAAMKYLPNEAQPPPGEIWGQAIPRRLPDDLIQLTRQMLRIVGFTWWQSPLHRLQADAVLANWISRMILRIAEPGTNPVEDVFPDASPGFQQDVELLSDMLDQGHGVQDWASALGISSRTLQRRCREHADCHPQEVVNLLRENRAETMLSRREHTISDVARSCGFESQEPFSRWFKARFGRSPGQWRPDR